MSDNEYEEENLDDFMINASSILFDDSKSDKEAIIDTLKQHLSHIFHEQSEMKNFFSILNNVIFKRNENDEDSNPRKISNKQPFKLYPIIFSFNPKTSYYYFDYFLNSIKKCCCEENRPDFRYLSIIFSEVIISFFSDEKKNKNLMKKNLLLEQNKKAKLYEKILNYCNENIKTNHKTEQSFGLLLLTEFIEKCPLVKDEKYLENLFKIISDFLDDRWFECKLDLLNCTISLIFTAETKFKPYANICLFRVLDYLTDTEWMKRKLAINIVYTLVFYCKEEIMAVKENIIDFLNMLKEDPVDEVRDVCIQTLAFIDANDPDGEEKNDIENLSIEKNKPKNIYNRAKNNNGLNINEDIKVNNKNNKISNIKKNDLEKKYQFLDKKEINYEEKESNNTIEPTMNGILQHLKKIQDDQNSFTNIINNLQQVVDNNFLSLNERIEKLEKIAGISNKNFNKINNNILPYKSNSSNFNSNQNNNINNLKEKNDDFDIKSNKGIEKIKNKKIILINKKDEQNKIDDLKKKFIDGKYNEALIESKDNDKYLIKLLPLLDKNIIQKIEISIVEEIVNRLNKKLSIICLGNGRENINDILSFYIRLIKSKINLKLYTQFSIKDTLKFLKSKSNNKLIQSDFNNIDIILKSLKI